MATVTHLNYLLCGFGLLCATFVAADSVIPVPLRVSIPSAETMAQTCVGCHGDSGVSTGPASPSIAGMSKTYIIRAMQQFRDNKRPTTIMDRIAKGYSDAEIVVLAEYFAKQKYTAADQKFDPSLAKQGKLLHEKFCEQCHEQSGTVAGDDSGFLAGQWSLYLQYSLEDFISQKRPMDKKMQEKLQDIQKQYADKGIQQLLHYYASKK